jgi:UDP-N-acetylglucosamine transferase subunit ALG13
VILVTVGAQHPFDRLIAAVDRWAMERGRDDVFAQIGRTRLRPVYIRHAERLNPVEMRDQMLRAECIVAHAGMGTIIAALELRRPLLVVPRRPELRETRNAHQVATAQHLRQTGRVAVAMDEFELMSRLDALAEIAAGPAIPRRASESLLETIAGFIGVPEGLAAPQPFTLPTTAPPAERRKAA